MIIDLRPINAATIKEAWPMPLIDAEVQDFRGSVCFANLDFVSRYWQLPVHADSEDSCGIITPHGVYSTTRVLQGLKNETPHFLRTIEPLFQHLRSNLKAWLDDFSLHAESETKLLDTLEAFFHVCEDKGLFLSIKKSVFFSTSIKWCGRIISTDGHTMDPANIQSLREMEIPKTADELAQFIYCAWWMALAIPDFARWSGPLIDVLESAYTKSGKRTTRSIKGMQLRSLAWGPRHAEAFKNVQASLLSATKLAYPDGSKILCL